MDNLGPLGITSVNEDMILNDIKKNYNQIILTIVKLIIQEDLKFKHG